MNPIEEEIRTLLHSKVVEAPVRDEPPAFVLRRSRTLRVVNAIGATAAAAAVVIGVVIGAQSLGDRRNMEPLGPGDRVVPWRPLPVLGTVNKGDLVPGREVPCGIGDIVSAVTNDFPGLGFNPRSGDVSCKIDPRSPRFKVVIRDNVGGNLPVDVVVGESAPAVYVKGNDSYVEGFGFEWSNYCGRRPDAVLFDVTLPDGETIRVPFGPKLLPACVRKDVRSVLTFGSVVGIVPRQVSGSLLTNLGGSIKTQTVVSRGATLVYRVRVFNPLDQDVALEPCPDYLQAVTRPKGDGVAEATEAWRLNCEPVPGGTISAHSFVDFEMRFAIPADLGTGEWELSWSLMEGNGSGGSPARARIQVI